MKNPKAELIKMVGEEKALTWIEMVIKMTQESNESSLEVAAVAK